MNIYFVLIAGTLGMCLLAGGIITFTVVYRKRLMEQQVLIKETELRHQKELLHSTIITQENERKRLAADLHDEVGAMLAALRLALSQAQKQEDKDLKKAQLSEVKRLVDLASNSTRRISHDLMPPALETFGLAAALGDLLANLSTSGLKITADIPPGSTCGNSACDLAIYRIMQELYANTVKHSGATEIDIKMNNTDAGLEIIYRDNGHGFTSDQKAGKGLGLKNIESRLSVFHGELNVSSSPEGSVTRILVRPD